MAETGSPPGEEAVNWELVRTPLGEPWSGRARYAAAMYFYRRGAMTPETLEVYRLCSRLDHQDPLSIIRERGVGREWLERIEAVGNRQSAVGKGT